MHLSSAADTGAKSHAVVAGVGPLPPETGQLDVESSLLAVESFQTGLVR